MTAVATPAAARPTPPWLVVKDLFERLVDLPPAQRPLALLQADVARELQVEVLELLAQHDAEERGGAFLAQPALLRVEQEADIDRRGQRLGPWRLIGRLGRGGMGEVWEARRDDGAYEATVAVKVLRGAADSTLLLEHFAQEQRLLARLNHPHIARLLDAGRTDDQRPYFVLEAVVGQSIDAACRGLALEARLRLFLQLADAVAHAHRQQLIHRDLKPANVLVTTEGQVKLLDFGIAQALDHAPEHAGARPLTPGYASPEQVRGEPVTAATDVYSLGVLLHVLLTGQRPLGRDGHTTRAVLRAVLSETPGAPSAAPPLEGSVERRRLAGDLDSIVLKALAKQADARYASVDAMAADLRAFLAGAPVSARPAGLGYLAGKFVRRHRAAVAASALALLAIVAGLGSAAWQAREAVAALALAALAVGLGVSTWQARRARASRDEARSRLAETSGLVKDILMRYADMTIYLPGGMRMRADLLTDTIAYLERVRLSAPDDAQLAGELAKALSRLADMQQPGLDATLDQPEDALRNGEAALALFGQGEPAHRDDPPYFLWWARAMRVRARARRNAGDVTAALQTNERMRGFLQTALKRFPGDTELRSEYASVLFAIGQCYFTLRQEHSLHRPQQAMEAFAASEAAYRELLADDPDNGDDLFQLGTIAGAQAIVFADGKQWPQALAAARRAVAWREQALALKPENVAYREGVAGEINNLTRWLLEDPAHFGEALQVSERGEQLIRALEADDPGVPTWAARRKLFAMHRGRALLAAGQAQAGLQRLQDAEAPMAEAQSGPTLRRRGWCRLEIARAQRALGHHDAAAQSLVAARRDLAAFLQEQPDDAEGAELLARAEAERIVP